MTGTVGFRVNDHSKGPFLLDYNYAYRANEFDPYS